MTAPGARPPLAAPYVGRMAEPRFVVVMGVSGSGKTTVARALADASRLGASSRATTCTRRPTSPRWRRGRPLTDADRAPWLEAIGRWIDARGGKRGRRGRHLLRAPEELPRPAARRASDASASATSRVDPAAARRTDGDRGRSLHAGLAAAQPAHDARAAGSRRAGDHRVVGRATETVVAEVVRRLGLRVEPARQFGADRSARLVCARFRAHSSAGRAPPLQGGCQGFESLCAHPVDARTWQRPAACWARTHGAHRPIVATRTPPR